MELWLFQGTFNPIHNAHLRVGEFAVKKCGAEKVLFIPAYCPPHKEADLSCSKHRLEMVKRAIQGNSHFEVSDIEFQLGGKSYTYRTICELRKKYGADTKISFIIGTDAFRYIKTWYETDKLKKLVKFRVFTRDKNFDKSEFEYLRAEGYDFELMPLEFEDISSTELRNAVKSNKDLKNLVPEKVEEYIKENELYKN